MAQWSRALATLPESWTLVQAPTRQLTDPRDLMSSFYSLKHQAHM